VQDQWIRYVIIAIGFTVAISRNVANMKTYEGEPVILTEEQIRKTE